MNIASVRFATLLVGASVALGNAACNKSDTAITRNNAANVTAQIAVSRTTGVLANGTDSVTITVTVADPNNKAMSGVPVTLSVTGANNVLGMSPATDANGVSQTSLTSTTAEAKTITAHIVADGETIVLSTHPVVNFVGLVVTASPTSVRADGGSAATVTLTLQDSNGVGVTGIPVHLATSGSSNLLSAGDGNTNAQGVFTATLVSTQAETKTLTGTGPGLTASGAVTFTATNVCEATPFLPSVPWTPLTGGAMALVVNDFNGDHINDAIVLAPRDANVYFHAGRGDGTFGAGVPTALDANATMFLALELNGDSNMDIASIVPDPNGWIAVSMGVGDGTFSAPAIYPFFGQTNENLVSADFNHDQKPDLAFATTTGAGVLMNDGSGNFYGPFITATAGSPLLVAANDFDQDGNQDIAIATNTDSNITVVFGSGDGNFPTQAVSTGVATPSDLQTALINADNIPDLVAFTASSTPVGPSMTDVYVLFGNSNGTFQAPTDIFSQAGTGSTNVVDILLHDFNGDGNADVLLSTYNPVGSGVPSLYQGLLNTGDGNFFAPVTYGISYGVVAMAVADVNGDHVDDIMGVSNYDSTLSIVLRSGASIFPENGWTYLLSPVNSTAPGLASNDFNGDGNLDLLSVVGGSFSMYLGAGNGNFTFAGNPNAGTSVGRIVVGDFNGDGNQDIAFAQQSNAVGIMLGTADGNFMLAYNANTNIVPTNIVVADFNGDRLPDLAISGTTDPNTPIDVLINSDNGNFLTAVSLDGNAGTTLAAADFTGDHNIDLVLADTANQDFALFVGNGNGTFQPPVQANLVAEPVIYTNVLQLLPGDFNQDGNMDVLMLGTLSVSPGSSAKALAVWLNNGAGGFTAGQPFGAFAATSPGVAALGDINGDGHVDIVVPNTNNNETSVFFGNGDGTFQALQEYGVGQTAPYVAVIGDFNKDHKDDVAMLALSDVRVMLQEHCSVAPLDDVDRQGCAAAGVGTEIIVLLTGLYGLRRRRSHS